MCVVCVPCGAHATALNPDLGSVSSESVFSARVESPIDVNNAIGICLVHIVLKTVWFVCIKEMDNGIRNYCSVDDIAVY